MTFEVARDDPRLFDEVLDWLVRNEPLVSLRRLRTLCEGPEDERLSAAAIEWMQRQRRPSARGPQLSVTTGNTEPLFRDADLPTPRTDPVFSAFGFARPLAEPSGKSRGPGPHRADQLCVPAPSTAWHSRPRRGRSVPPDGRHRIRLGSGRRKVIGLLKAQRAGGADFAECRGSRRYAGVRWWRAALGHRPLPLGASLGSRTARASDLPRLAHVVWSIAPDPALAYASGARRSLGLSAREPGRRSARKGATRAVACGSRDARPARRRTIVERPRGNPSSTPSSGSRKIPSRVVVLRCSRSLPARTVLRGSLHRRRPGGSLRPRSRRTPQ